MNGAYVYVKDGKDRDPTVGGLQKNNGYVVTNPDPITLVAGLTIANIDENDVNFSGFHDDTLRFELFNSLHSPAGSTGYVDLFDGSTDKDNGSSHTKWQGPSKIAGSDEITSGALMLRAQGDNDGLVALDCESLSFTKAFSEDIKMYGGVALKEGRYGEGRSKVNYNANVNFFTAGVYTDHGDTFGDSSINTSNTAPDYTNDYVLTVKGHIVLEKSNDDANSPWSTINSVQFTDKGDIYTNGNIEATNVTAFSDRRLKKNIVDMDKPMDLVNKFRPVTYNWNADQESKSLEYGFIAQEVQESFPSLVQESTASGLLSVDYMKICSILCGAVRDLNNEVQSLKASLAPN